MPKISIITVTQNAKEIIRDCLYSVYAQDFKDFEVIIVDNNSKDGTKEFIKNNFPRIILLENKDNHGFCKANNQGIIIARSEFILTLNSDVVLEYNFLTGLINASKNIPPAIGMISPKILKIDKKTIDSTGLILTKSRRFYNRGSGEIDSGQYDDKRDIFGPCAAAALYKKDMLKQIKIRGNPVRSKSPKATAPPMAGTSNGVNSCPEYFDNDFFFLVEDVDLAWRARLQGWRGYFVPEARCYHLGNSSAVSKQMRQYLSFRNRYFMVIKNEKRDDFIKNSIYLWAYDLPRFFCLIITNRLIPKAVFEVIYHSSRMFRKRNSQSLFYDDEE